MENNPNNKLEQQKVLNAENTSTTPTVETGGSTENKTSNSIQSNSETRKESQNINVEEKPQNEIDKLTKYYNLKQDKPRANAIVLMVLSIVAMVASIVIGLYFTVFLAASVFGFDTGKLFDKGINTLTFGLSGLMGAILYIVGGTAIILLIAITYIYALGYFKLFKNLKKTKNQPYYVAAFNGTLIQSCIWYFILFALSMVLTLITISDKSLIISLIMFVVLTAITLVLLVDVVVELIIGRVKYSKLADQELKTAIKKEAHDRYKLYLFKNGSRIEKRKTRKRWF